MIVENWIERYLCTRTISTCTESCIIFKNEILRNCVGNNEGVAVYWWVAEKCDDYDAGFAQMQFINDTAPENR